MNPSATTTGNGRFYLPELDTLRFLAFLGVFIHHSFPISSARYSAMGLPPQVAEFLSAGVEAGRFGVDLFFLLSSFLITTLLIRENEASGRIDIKGFWIRRCLRIWPLYFVFVAVAGFILPRIFHFVPPPETNHIPGLLTFTHNWAIAFSDAGRGSPTLVLWSVSLEEQFYLLWPIVLSVAGVGRIAKIAVGMIIVATACRIAAIAADASWYFLWSATPLRMGPIALGALLAVGAGRIPALGVNFRLALFAGGAGILVASMRPAVIPDWWYAAIFPLAAVACAMIFLSVYRAPWSLLRHPILVYLGKISYGLYVFHSLAIIFAARIAPEIPLGRTLTAFALTVALAAASYRFIESPFLRIKTRFAHIASRPT